MWRVSTLRLSNLHLSMIIIFPSDISVRSSEACLVDFYGLETPETKTSWPKSDDCGRIFETSEWGPESCFPGWCARCRRLDYQWPRWKGIIMPNMLRRIISVKSWIFIFIQLNKPVFIIVQKHFGKNSKFFRRRKSVYGLSRSVCLSVRQLVTLLPELRMRGKGLHSLDKIRDADKRWW
jgi:hypothetical protein